MPTALGSAGTRERRAFDVDRVRRDFPALELTVHGQPLAYLDNAATAQKPRSVLAAETGFYREQCANVHRGVHALSLKATVAYEGAREKVRRHLNAAELAEIVFVRGTTEAINLVASSYGRQHVGAGDEVLITEMEHHSNIVPWQILCEERGARLRVAPIDDRGDVILERYQSLLSERTRVVSMIHVSNALGTINPVRQMTELARAAGAVVVVDGAQALPHMAVDVAELGCDFYAFSSHKAFGPTGVGALYGRLELLREMVPYQSGGEMIRSVTFDKTDYADPPARFEAGTPNIAGAVGMGAALDYMEQVDLELAAAYEEELLEYATERLQEVPGLRIIGQARRKASVISMELEGAHPHDIGTILDRRGVAVRTGHHCAQPVMARYGVPATTRASLAFYNTREEVERLVAGLDAAREVLA